MSIHPLPQFEADLSEYLKEKADREAYERLRAPTTIVVRFGVMKLIGEFPYDGDAKPGCGSKIVVRTHRGTEVGEMLTSTCENAGCSKSVTRKEMLEYIENSGGADYPFLDSRHNKYGVKGRALRLATAEDLARDNGLADTAKAIKARAQALSESTGVNVKIVHAEPILGGETLTIYYLSEERVDFGPLLSALKEEYPETRVDLRQIGARDEARINADYERCGQYCCCKNFLKVLKPVSMRSAKVQKATLDPLKISGRCGRLMCCLRYEDKTYSELKKNLPHRKTRVGTPHGDGIVLETQILTQLVLVRLDDSRQVAVPVEELTKPGEQPAPAPAPATEREPTNRAERPRGKRPQASSDAPAETRDAPKRKRRRKPKSDSRAAGDSEAAPRDETGGTPTDDASASARPIGRRRKRKPGAGDKPKGNQSETGSEKRNAGDETSAPSKRRRRRGPSRGESTGGDQSSGGGAAAQGEEGGTSEKPRKRRRRRSGGSGGAGGSSQNKDPKDPGSSDGGA